MGIAAAMGAPAALAFSLMMSHTRPGLEALDYGIQSSVFSLTRILAPLAAGVAVPVWNRGGAPLTRIVQGIYRKLLALPIARGWIRA
ncbi:hypothetical protein G6F64_015136 [Rhizopus arrhizus]|uniref:Uncharacterized protein n=1 Tax=Rhizopus oryzae TaxID=64495 RepID=A0A9P7BIU2_RHIOR|nr:hypothetical protein G6F64_015136 [Rhizopus arrhizus]